MVLLPNTCMHVCIKNSTENDSKRHLIVDILALTLYEGGPVQL